MDSDINVICKDSQAKNILYDVMTLKIAQNYDVQNLGFKRLLKVGATFAILHIILSIGYLSLLVLFNS